MKATLFQVAIGILLAGVVRAQDSGYIIKWYSGKVPASNRRTWLDNQLQAASLPALTNDQVASLKVRVSLPRILLRSPLMAYRLAWLGQLRFRWMRWKFQCGGH